MKGVARGWLRGWQEIRGANALRLLRNVRPSRQLLTNLFAFTANSLSLGLSNVQGNKLHSALEPHFVNQFTYSTFSRT